MKKASFVEHKDHLVIGCGIYQQAHPSRSRPLGPGPGVGHCWMQLSPSGLPMRMFTLLEPPPMLKPGRASAGNRAGRERIRSDRSRQECPQVA